MKDLETQQQFVALRVQGLSFAKISEKLGVAKSTLILWSRKFQFDIQNLRAIEVEALQMKFLASVEERVARLTARLQLLETELDSRKLSEIPTARLFGLTRSLSAQIRQEIGHIQFTMPADSIPYEERHQELQDWVP